MAKKTYFEQRMEMLDSNYDKYFNSTLKEIQNGYINAYKDIELEIARWYNDMEVIKSKNPSFRFSELKQLEDLQEQIKLILEELSKVEEQALTDGLNGLYVTDYMDFGAIDKKYGMLDLHTPLPEFNNIQSVQVLESYLTMPTINTIKQATKEALKHIDIEWWYDAIQGKWYNTRIYERAEKLGYSIENQMRQAIIRGDSYNKVADVIAQELDISFKSAKTLVATELRTAETTATIHNAEKLGYNALKRQSCHDNHVCKICQEMDGTIYPVGTVRAGDFMLHPNDRCVLVEVLIDEDGKQLENPFEQEAKKYVEDRAKANRERTKAIREKYGLDEKGKQPKKRKAKK